MDEMTLDQRRAVAMANARMRAAEAEGQPMSGDELTPPAPEPRFGEKVNAAISSIPRQAGLAARYGVEGMADVAGIVTNPIAATANAMGANLPRLRDATSGVLDKIGLPSPNTPTERVVGDASRMLAGGGGMVKGAQMASKVAPWAASLAARPELQAASGIGAGLSGGYTRETGGDPLSQGVAALAGGLLAPAGLVGGMSAVRGIKDVIGSIRAPTSPQVNVYINQAIEQAGYKVKDVPVKIVNTIKDDAAQAMKMGDLSPDALRRLVDYRMIGATPARGNLTLNPVDVTNQKNLSKIGVNTSNKNLQSLALRENDNTGVLLGKLNELGANTADDAYAGGQRVMGALAGKQNAAKQRINSAYSQARDSQGRAAPLEREAFVYDAYNRVAKENKGAFLPAEVKSLLEEIRVGKTDINGIESPAPFNVDVIDNLKTILSNASRSGDGNTRAAVRLVRDALDDVAPSGIAGESLNAFNTARGLNRNWMGLVEKTPALKAVVDGVDPDKFVSDYIIRSGGNANVMDVARLKNQIKDSPNAMQAVREQLLAHLKGKATSGKPDEAMTFSQSGYNNAFTAIGERKLRMFFSKPEIDQLKAVGRVAMYEQIQPSGAAVNNSNSGALAVAKVFDWIANNPVASKVPFLQSGIEAGVMKPLQGMQASFVRNVPKSLNLPQKAAATSPRLPLPLLLTPGLLEDRRN